MWLRPFITCSALAVVAACSSSPQSKPAESEATAKATPAPEAPRALRYDTVLSGVPYNLKVDIHQDVAEVCNLPAGKPFFAFDSSRLDAQDKTILVMIADCMKTGPLAGRSVLLTGFADHVGEYDYNVSLGLSRSKSVADELIELGV
jgi:outer membrane protein OmpA-like peptidoglycan-associated protein